MLRFLKTFKSELSFKPSLVVFSFPRFFVQLIMGFTGFFKPCVVEAVLLGDLCFIFNRCRSKAALCFLRHSKQDFLPSKQSKVFCSMHMEHDFSMIINMT